MSPVLRKTLVPQRLRLLRHASRRVTDANRLLSMKGTKRERSKPLHARFASRARQTVEDEIIQFLECCSGTFDLYGEIATGDAFIR